MFLGILIGLTMAGVCLLVTNGDHVHFNNTLRITRGIMRCIAFTFILIGLCGSIGWILEVVL